MNTPSRPLITLAIMAYNQQDLILETIKGAFAQTYSPLEIILSDDHSTDDTFAIMEEAAREYTGPHRVVTNRNSQNLCMIGHLLAVCDLANGELLVQNDGDDISLPYRVETLAAIWRDEKPSAMVSHFEMIDGKGATLRPHGSPSFKIALVEQTFGRPSEMNILGATAAYDLGFMRTFPRPEGRYYFEDVYMTFMVHLHNGTIRKIMEPLVKYRQHAASITNGGSQPTTLAGIKASHRKAADLEKNLLLLYGFFERVVTAKLAREVPSHPIDMAALRRQKALTAVHADWIAMSPLTRLAIFAEPRHQPIRRWLAPRLLGLDFFSALKYLVSLATGSTRATPQKTAPVVAAIKLKQR